MSKYTSLKYSIESDVKAIFREVEKLDKKNRALQDEVDILRAHVRRLTEEKKGAKR